MDFAIPISATSLSYYDGFVASTENMVQTENIHTLNMTHCVVIFGMWMSLLLH